MHCRYRLKTFMTSFICIFALIVFAATTATTTAEKPPLIPNGSQQMYALVNKVTMTDTQAHSSPTPFSSLTAKETSYTFKSMLKINCIWNSPTEQLLQIYFTKSSISATAKTEEDLTQEITKIPDRPFYISLVDGKPQKVIAHTSRDQSLLNLERGIASLFQLQYTNDEVNELDVSGQCKVTYQVKSSTKVKKTKSDCSHWDLRVHYKAEQPLGVVRHSTEQLNFDLTADGTLLKVQSTEMHRITLAAKTDVASEVTSIFTLSYIVSGGQTTVQLDYPTLDEAIKSLLEYYRVFDIEADVDGAISDLNSVTLREKFLENLTKLNSTEIGKQKLAVTLAELLPYARITKKEEFIDLLQENVELQPQIVDLLGAVQTIDAHNAINEAFNYADEKYTDLIEKYLQSLAVGTHPERAIIEDLFNKFKSKKQPIENEKLRDTVLQTLTALTRQFGFDVNDPLALKIRSYIIEQLTIRCKDDVNCKIPYLRSLKNLQDIKTISVLIENALANEAPVTVAALTALKSFPTVHFSEKERKIFAQIFYQKKNKYDTTARIYALDILLAMKPNKKELGEMLDYLTTNDVNFEIKTYLLQKLRMLSEKCKRFNAMLKSCLKMRPNVNNYHVLAQKGLTTVLMRQLTQTPAFNESLLSVQEIYQGVLKRGSIELILSAGREQTNTFKLGLFTSGLSNFVGDGGDDDAENEVDDSPVTAGMEISALGVSFRPLIFFNGKAELMGHVWSGTASESTPAYQATIFLHDHEHYMVLSSGATVYLRILGTRSIDLNGKVTFSLWNRNAQTEIAQNVGSAIVGLMTAGFTYGRVTHQYTLTNEPNLSLQAHVDFYSGVKLCMQLQRPEMLLSYFSKKSVVLNAAEKPFTKTIKSTVTHKSPGCTLALNQKNNDMCNMIFNS